MSILKNYIQNFLKSNSEKEIRILRFVQKIDFVHLPNLFGEFSKTTKQVFFFSKPIENFTLLAFDNLNIKLEKHFFSGISSNNQSLPNFIEYNSKPPDNICIPLFLGSKKFSDDSKETIWSDFDFEDWFIPKIILIEKNASFFLVINLEPGETNLDFLDELENILFSPNYEKEKNISKPTKILAGNSEEWISQINNCLKAIKVGRVEKIVLARRVEVDLENFLMSDSLQLLQNKYPQCFIFAYKKNNSIFFGATPEKLFFINNYFLETEAIAGSAPRGIDEKDDLFLENKLLTTPKELNEHQNVVRFIRENLGPLSTNLFIDDKMSIKKLSNIQHIRTAINANVKEGINILDIIKRMHPTPAVCGVPRMEAFKLIDEEENFDRGLYAGVVGWFDENQSGEFIVGIRSALLTNKKLYAYAGCGIVEGSDPIAELNETELKLKPILSLLKNETTS